MNKNKKTDNGLLQSMQIKNIQIYSIDWKNKLKPLNLNQQWNCTNMKKMMANNTDYAMSIIKNEK